MNKKIFALFTLPLLALSPLMATEQPKYEITLSAYDHDPQFWQVDIIASTVKILNEHTDSNQAVIDRYIDFAGPIVEYANEHPNFDIRRIMVATSYSAAMHKGQYRKDAARTPYIIHPIGVASSLWQEGGVRDEDTIIAALLHDTLEDTDATYDELHAHFGPQVASIVEELTNDPSLSSAQNKQRQVDHAPHMSQKARLVKLADRLYNVRDLTPPPPAWSQDKVDGYYSWAEKLLAALEGTNAPLEAKLTALIEAHKDTLSPSGL